MPKVTCPECRAAAEVDEEDLGQDVYCPSCGEIFRAKKSFAEPPMRLRAEPPVARSPRRRREDDYDDDYDDDDYEEERERRRRGRRKRRSSLEHREEVVEDARRATFLPALFSIIACVIGVLYHIADGLLVWMDPQILNQNPFGGAGMPLEAYLAFRAFSILWELVILIGSVMMMKLRSRQFAMITMIMHIIPCAGVCCLIGLPVGIWGLVTVLRPDVADGFAYVEQYG